MTIDDIKLPQSETDFEEEEELFRQKILKMIIEKVMANRPELVEAVTSVANATMNTTLRWQKERMIKKTCKWLKVEGGVKFIDDEIYYHHIDECIENFKKAMEE